MSAKKQVRVLEERWMLTWAVTPFGGERLTARAPFTVSRWHSGGQRGANPGKGERGRSLHGHEASVPPCCALRHCSSSPQRIALWQTDDTGTPGPQAHGNSGPGGGPQTREGQKWEDIYYPGWAWDLAGRVLLLSPLTPAHTATPRTEPPVPAAASPGAQRRSVCPRLPGADESGRPVQQPTLSRAVLQPRTRHRAAFPSRTPPTVHPHPAGP